MSEPRDQADGARCKAISHEGDPPDNPLFTPPCDCPRCAPPHVPADEQSGTTTIWIAADGRPVRHEVDDLDLGEVGHQLLG